MVIFLAGASHTGKTVLAQKILETYGYPYLSIDHLKMGLIRSGRTNLTPLSSDEALTEYLWPVVREMAKTAIENGQNLVIEGCYIPFDWEKDFDEAYLKHIRYLCLVMSGRYIRERFCDIAAYANAAENRLGDSYCTLENVLRENEKTLKNAREHGVPVFLIDGAYDTALFMKSLMLP